MATRERFAPRSSLSAGLLSSQSGSVKRCEPCDAKPWYLAPMYATRRATCRSWNRSKSNARRPLPFFFCFLAGGGWPGSASAARTARARGTSSGPVTEAVAVADEAAPAASDSIVLVVTARPTRRQSAVACLSGEAHERLSKVTCRAQLAVAGHDPDARATPVASPRDVAVQRWWNGARELWLDAAAHPLARNGSSVHAVAKKNRRSEIQSEPCGPQVSAQTTQHLTKATRLGCREGRRALEHTNTHKELTLGVSSQQSQGSQRMWLVCIEIQESANG
jgi:hypothetical protein